MVSAGELVLRLKAEADTKGFDKMRHSLAKVAKEHKRTAGFVKGTAQMSKGLKNAFVGAANAAKHGARAAKNLGRSLNEVAAEAKSAGKAAVQALKGIKDAAVGAGKTVGNLAVGVGKIGMKAAGAAFNVAKKGMIGLAAATTAGAYQFASLQQTVAEMTIVAGINSSEIDGLTESLIRQSATSIFSAQSTAEAAATIGALGNFGDDAAVKIEKLTETSQKLATAAGFDDMAKSAETLIGAIRTFGIETEDGAETANTLMQAANISALSMDDMGTALQFVGGRANQMGMSLEETLATLATLRNMNIDAGVASRSLSQAMGHLITPTEEGAKWIRRLGIEVTDADGNFKSMEEIIAEVSDAQGQLTEIFHDSKKEAAVMSEIFGEMGSRAMIPLTSSIGDLENGFIGMNTQMQNIDPLLLQSNFDTMSATMENRMKVLKNGLQSVGMTLGSAFLEPLMTAGDDGSSAFEKLTAVFTDPKFISSVGLIGKALGELATTVLPIIAEVFQMLAPAIAKLLDFFSRLLGSTEVQAMIESLMGILGEFLGEFMVIMEDLFPVIKEVFAALMPFMPLLRIFAKLVLLAFKMIKPWLKLLIVLLDVFFMLMPLLLDIGKVILAAIVTPFQIATKVIAGLIRVAADIVGIFDPKLAKKMRAVAREFSNVGDEVGKAQAEINSFTMDPATVSFDALPEEPAFDTEGDFYPDAPEGGAGSGAALSVQSTPGGAGASTTNIIIQGDVVGDEEGINRVNDSFNDELNRRGLRGVR